MDECGNMCEWKSVLGHLNKQNSGHSKKTLEWKRGKNYDWKSVS